MKKAVLFLLIFTFVGCTSNDADKETMGITVIPPSNVNYPLPLTTDSLLLLLRTVPHDTNKVNILNALGQQFKNNDPDTSIILCNLALTVAERLSVSADTTIAKAGKKSMANALSNLGAYYYLKADYPSALDYYFKALRIREELGAKNVIASTLGNIGIVYTDQIDYPKALEYHFKALKLDQELEKSSDETVSKAAKKGVAVRLGNIGSVYSDQAEHTSDSAQRKLLNAKALDCYFKALEIGEELHDKNRIARQLGNIGNVYSNQAEQDLNPVNRLALKSSRKQR